MKKTIRNGIFETNSSSVHVIAISKEKPKVLPSSIIFGHGEFGWEFDSYSDSYSKADYFNEAIHAVYSNYKDVEQGKERIKAVQDRVIADLAEKGIEAVFEPDQYYNQWGYESGYIDHGRELKNWVNDLLGDTDKLINYLFSSDSYVETGNDNYDGCPNVKDVDQDKYYTYEKWN